MKMFTSLVVIVLSVLSLRAGEVALVIQPLDENGNQFKLGETYANTAKGGFYIPTSLRYYISRVKLHLHDGTNVPMTDAYALVDLRDVQRYVFGEADLSAGVDSVTFYIGVDPEHNHLDPTTYPDWHPLALKNPSMHWGWSAGYRFVCYEGNGGTSKGNITSNFQIHSLDDKLYTRCTVKCSNTGGDIPLVAYYERLLRNIDVSKGLINHGSTDEALTIMMNIGFRGDKATQIFQGKTTTSVSDVTNADPVRPNPASDLVILPVGTTRVIVYSVRGEIVVNATLSEGANLLSVASLPQGTYSLVLHHADSAPTYETLSIIR